jgi:outer membrane protein TolC
MKLSLKDAVAVALAPEGSLRLQTAEELVRQARARSAESRAALLPGVSAAVGYQDLTRNLAAAGIRLHLPVPGFTFPTLVGPFTVFDARATASQSVLNLGAIRRYQASRSGIGLAEAEQESARDEIRAAVARLYLGAVRAQSVTEAAQADVALAEALLKLATHQKAAGTGTGIEITRAKVQLANAKQRLLLARDQLAAARLQLLRALHLGLETQLELTEPLSFAPVQPPPMDAALREAFESRADWQAQKQRLESARLALSAARMDRMPTITAFADYGSIGSGLTQAIPTRTFGLAVQIPIFDGGRVDARRALSASQYRQEEIRADELRAQIELEIRLALDSLQSSAEQVATAEEGLALAEDEVAQAQRRSSSGVSPAVEVADAQTRLERARENRIAALYGHYLARINLATALGAIRTMTE